MEDILELIFTVVGNIVDGVKYKTARRRNAAYTAFYSLFTVGVECCLIVPFLDGLKHHNTALIWVCGCIMAAVAGVAAWLIIRANLRNWPKH